MNAQLEQKPAVKGKGSFKMPQLPVSENMAPSHPAADSTNNPLTYTMTVAAIVLMTAYFAISVLAVAR